MAGYIEKEPLCAWLENMGVSDFVIRKIESEANFPTADVVPKSEVEKLELTLQGVMWSVDKWLDEKDYDADPIKRAITMREKTLKIVENLKAEVAREIFEEIERLLREHSDYEILCDGKSLWYYEESLGEDIAELKNKYTEGE